MKWRNWAITRFIHGQQYFTNREMMELWGEIILIGGAFTIIIFAVIGYLIIG